MNLKSFLLGITMGAIVIGGVCVYTNNLKKEEISMTKGNVVQKEASIIEEKGNLEIIGSEKVYSEEYKVECYEVIMKNTSGKNLKRIEFSLGDRNI